MRPSILSLLALDRIWTRLKLQQNPKPEPVVEAPAAEPEPEQPNPFQIPIFDIGDIREKLNSKDNEIAGLLTNFRLAANHKEQNKQPDSDLLARVNLPTHIEKLAIDRNIPREVFSGVAYFLDLTLNDNEQLTRTTKGGDVKDLTGDFKRLCELFADRHDISREIANHKKTNPDKYRKKATDRVITFIPDRHQEVVDNMSDYCVKNGTDPDIGTTLINWYALANAGWQDQAINDNKGPFSTEGSIDNLHLTNKAHHREPMEEGRRYEMRYPKPAA